MHHTQYQLKDFNIIEISWNFSDVSSIYDTLKLKGTAFFHDKQLSY